MISKKNQSCKKMHPLYIFGLLTFTFLCIQNYFTGGYRILDIFEYVKLQYENIYYYIAYFCDNRVSIISCFTAIE
jgi:hypothetical protein